MSIEALILGKLHARPERRTSKAGREFVTCKMRVPVAEGESVFLNGIAFDAAACAALLALDTGDALALAGALRVGAWLDREGNPKPNVDLVASRVLTVYEVKRKRDAAQAATPPARAPKPPPGRDEFDAERDEWLHEGQA